MELWNPQEKKWLFLFRLSNILRFPVNGGGNGTHNAIGLARLKQILTPQDSGRGYASQLRNAKVKVTITDIGLLELSNERTIFDRRV